MRRLPACVALAVLSLVMLPIPGLAQCAMCRTALESSVEGQAMGRSFNHAILVLLAAPYLLAGSFAALVFRRRLSSAWRTALQRVGLRPAPQPPLP